MSANAHHLRRSFYERPTLIVARSLLGSMLVRHVGELRIAGFIIETEAYVGESDRGCHAWHGKTRRNAVMYGPAGRAYVYFTYGMHWMLNAVTESDGFPAAVLIRGIEIQTGKEIVDQRRHGRDTHGPAKLTQALDIDGRLNGCSLLDQRAGLWIEEGFPIEENDMLTGPRVGLNGVPEPWVSMPWRFRVHPEVLRQVMQAMLG